MVRQTTKEWSANEEFSYYGVEKRLSIEHAKRQKQWQDERHFFGQTALHSLGLGSARAVDGMDILDIGAGEASVSQAIAATFRPRVVWALDAVPKQIFAPAVFGEHNRIHYVVGNALNVPFANASFDLVIANLFVHHVPERRALFEEVRRVLRPGGEFRCFEPNALVDFVVHWLRGEHQLSPNERPLFQQELITELQAVFGNETHCGYWARLQTSALGPLSPGFQFVSRVDGAPPSERPEPTPIRPLEPTGLANLLLDSGVNFRDEVIKQIEVLAAHISEIEGDFKGA